MSERDSICAVEEKLEARICPLCKSPKSITAFSRNKKFSDGLEKVCRECFSARRRLRYNERPEQYRKSNRERPSHRMPSLETMRARRARSLEQKAKRKEREAAYKKEYNAKFPEKARAQKLLRAAVKRGEIVRQDKCQRCDKGPPEVRIEASHHDYGKPYDVEWLCPSCHRRKDFKAAGRPEALVPDRRSIAQHAVDVLQESGMQAILCGDDSLMAAIADRAGVRPQGSARKMRSRVLSALQHSPLFSKEIVPLGFNGRMCRRFVLVESGGVS